MSDSEFLKPRVIGCPFPPCHARVTVLPLRGISLEMPAVELIKQHDVEPDSWYGACPASNMELPLSDRGTEILGEQWESFRKRAAEHAPLQGPQRPPAVGPTSPSPRWFKNSEESRHKPAPLQGRPRLRLVPDQPDNSKGGGATVASVAEVQAAISLANDSIQLALAATRAAAERFDQAQQQINFVRQSSVDALGGPAIAKAIEYLDLAMTQGALAIEHNETYRAGM